MPRTCTICAHPQRDEIEEALVRGEPFRGIAERHGVSATALHRHKTNDLSQALVRAAADQEVTRSDDLLGQVRNLVGRAYGILAQAEARGDHRMSLLALRELRGWLEFLGGLRAS